MYIFYKTTHVWHAYCISKYINPSTEQQRVNLTSKMAEADTQDARLSCIFIYFPVLSSCFAHQFDDTHSCKYTTLFLHLFQWIVFVLYVGHSINRYVLCFFVWEASARQGMVQWSPPDVRLTLRGHITKRKYTINSPKYAYKYHCTTKHECCSVYLIFTNHIFMVCIYHIVV